MAYNARTSARRIISGLHWLAEFVTFSVLIGVLVFGLWIVTTPIEVGQ